MAPKTRNKNNRHMCVYMRVHGEYAHARVCMCGCYPVCIGMCVMCYTYVCGVCMACVLCAHMEACVCRPVYMHVHACWGWRVGVRAFCSGYTVGSGSTASCLLPCWVCQHPFQMACTHFTGFPYGSVQATGSPSGQGTCPGEGSGSALQCACPENSTDTGAWEAIVRGVAKSRMWLSA